MPFGDVPPSLKGELAKVAKLSAIQSGLPPILRGAPTIAIIAGGAIAKATSGRNVVEERLLGADEAILLADLASIVPVKPVSAEKTRNGIQMMCARCRNRGGVDEFDGYDGMNRIWIRQAFERPSAAPPNGVWEV